MKKRTRNKLLAIATAILLAAVMVVPGIGVMKTYAAGKKYAAITLKDSTDLTKPLEIPLYKALDMPEDAIVPKSGFSFVIETVQPVAATDEKLAVLAGPFKNGYPQIADVVFAAGQTKDSSSVTTRTSCTGKTSVNFSGVEFTEPGVYRYKITEENANGYSNTAIGFDEYNVRILDIYIIDDGNGVLSYGGSTMTKYKSTDTIPAPDKLSVPTELTNKSSMFINKYPTAGLTFGKEVTGNQGSKDKYFKFTLEINGVAGTKMSVNYTNAEATISENPNDATTCIDADVTQPSEITLDNTTGKASVDFYLQDGQYITVNGFTPNATYKLKEEKEEYNQIKGIAEEVSSLNYDGVQGNDALDDGTLNASGEIEGTFVIPTGETEVASQYTGFTNDRSGVIPTGVILSVAPWAIAGVVILAGVVFFAIRSRKKYEEE